MQAKRYIWPLAMLLGLICMLGNSFQIDRRGNEATQVGKPFPVFSQLDLENKPKQKQALMGKLTLWHVWASWCHTCEIEWSQGFEKIPGVQWVGMAYQDTKPHIQMWLKARGDPFAFTLMDAKGNLAFQLGVIGVPETLLIDQNAKVIAKWDGPLSPQRWQQQVLPMVKAHLGENVI